MSEICCHTRLKNSKDLAWHPSNEVEDVVMWSESMKQMKQKKPRLLNDQELDIILQRARTPQNSVQYDGEFSKNIMQRLKANIKKEEPTIKQTETN